MRMMGSMAPFLSTNPSTPAASATTQPTTSSTEQSARCARPPTAQFATTSLPASSVKAASSFRQSCSALSATSLAASTAPSTRLPTAPTATSLLATTMTALLDNAAASAGTVLWSWLNRVVTTIILSILTAARRIALFSWVSGAREVLLPATTTQILALATPTRP